MSDMLSADPSDSEIIAVVDRWTDDLAAGDFDSAWARTEHDPYYAWTPSLIARVIAGYGLPQPARGGPFHVTPRATADGQPRIVIEREGARSPALAHISYDLPLNGEWSDLTATFVLERRSSGTALILEEIHVL